MGRTKPESVREGLQTSKTVTCIALHVHRIGSGLICIQTWNLTWWVRTVGQNGVLGHHLHQSSMSITWDTTRTGHGLETARFRRARPAP